MFICEVCRRAPRRGFSGSRATSCWTPPSPPETRPRRSPSPRPARPAARGGFFCPSSPSWPASWGSPIGAVDGIILPAAPAGHGRGRPRSPRRVRSAGFFSRASSRGPVAYAPLAGPWRRASPADGPRASPQRLRVLRSRSSAAGLAWMIAGHDDGSRTRASCSARSACSSTASSAASLGGLIGGLAVRPDRPPPAWAPGQRRARTSQPDDRDARRSASWSAR